MRKIQLLALLVTIPGLAQATYSGVRFIEASGFQLKGTQLPPTIEATFEIRCYQQFLRVIRSEFTDPVSKKVTISIGGLVSEDPRLACSSSSQKVVSAGRAFSGRQFEIVAIQK